MLIRQSTLLKYDEAFDNNQVLFPTDLVKKCKDERARLYELPLPVPIVEASIPIPIPEIPFVPRLPITKEFKKNTDANTFSIDEAKLVIHSIRTVDNSKTESTYTSKLNAIMIKFNISKVDGIFSDVYKFSYEEIVETFSGYVTPSQYIVMVPYIYDRSIKLKGIVDKLDKTGQLINRLRVEYKDSRDEENIDNRALKKADETNYIQHYKDLFAIEEEYSKTENGSQKHLISLMYSKGLLDNQGNVLMIPRNYYYEIELIDNDKEIITKPKEAGKGYNYYNYNNGRMLIQSYKTAPKFGAIDITLSNYTKAVINKSIKENGYLLLQVMIYILTTLPLGLRLVVYYRC
jgi:hypothetical protein